MVSLEILKEQLKRARAKKSLEDLATARAQEKKEIQKRRFVPFCGFTLVIPLLLMKEFRLRQFGKDAGLILLKVIKLNLIWLPGCLIRELLTL